MPGIAGTATGTVASGVVNLPTSGLTVVGIKVQKHTIGGYLSITIDPSRQAIFAFSTQRGVTTTNVPVNQGLKNGMWRVNFTLNSTALKFTSAGLTSGVVFVYFGTPLPDSKPLEQYAGIEVDVTTTSPVTLTFPSGTKSITGILYEAGYSTTETNVSTDFSFNTGPGVSVDLDISNKDDLQIYPMDDLSVPNSLSVTVTFDGTHVATGRLVAYYA